MRILAYTLENILYGISYGTKIRCAYVDEFVDTVYKYLPKSKSSKNLASTLHKIVKELSIYESLIDQSVALKLMVSKDLLDVIKTLERVTIKDPVLELRDAFKEYKKLLSSHDVQLDIPLFFVDLFPEPYSKFDFIAMNIDYDDERKYGAKRGIYLKKDSLEPLLSMFLLAHEIIHACISSKPTGQLARGLEDGICDLVAFYLSKKIIPTDIVTNIIINLHSEYQKTQLFRIYSESLRQAILIYKIYGMNGIMELITKASKKGRNYVKEIENMCVKGYYEEIGLEKGGWDKDMDRFADYFLSYPFSMIVSPLACYIAELITKYDPIRDFLTKNKIKVKEGMKAVKELSERVYLITIYEGKVMADETKLYTREGLLKYEPR